MMWISVGTYVTVFSMWGYVCLKKVELVAIPESIAVILTAQFAGKLLEHWMNTTQETKIATAPDAPNKS